MKYIESHIGSESLLLICLSCGFRSLRLLCGRQLSNSSDNELECRIQSDFAILRYRFPEKTARIARFVQIDFPSGLQKTFYSLLFYLFSSELCSCFIRVSAPFRISNRNNLPFFYALTKLQFSFSAKIF